MGSFKGCLPTQDFVIDCYEFSYIPVLKLTYVLLSFIGFCC